MEYKDAIELHTHLLRQFMKLRGSDPDRNGKAIPRTTVADVKQLIALWDTELAKVSSHAVSAESDRRRWRACKDRVALLTRELKPTDRYPENESLWRCMVQLAIYLESEKVAPSKWQLFKEAAEETVDALPERVERVASAWTRHWDVGLWIAGGLTALWLLTKD